VKISDLYADDIKLVSFDKSPITYSCETACKLDTDEDICMNYNCSPFQDAHVTHFNSFKSSCLLVHIGMRPEVLHL
jgi:hypothetical protein